MYESGIFWKISEKGAFACRVAAHSNALRQRGDQGSKHRRQDPRPEAPFSSTVEPHSLRKCLFLHLAPGVANLAATVLGLATLWNPSLPPELIFGVFTNVFVLIPVQLGYLYYLAKKRGNRGWSLAGIVVYRQPISLASLSPMGSPDPGANGAHLRGDGADHPLARNGFGRGSASSRKYQMAGGSEVAAVVLVAHIALTGILVPITEELYFRGYLLPRMPSRFRAPEARCAQPALLHLPLRHAVDDPGPHAGHPAAHLHRHPHAKRPPGHSRALPSQPGELLRRHIEAHWQPVICGRGSLYCTVRRPFTVLMWSTPNKESQ